MCSMSIPTVGMVISVGSGLCSVIKRPNEYYADGIEDLLVKEQLDKVRVGNMTSCGAITSENWDTFEVKYNNVPKCGDRVYMV